MHAAPRRISISLLAHTNVGKTTLARTLLGADIGEVRDAAHVTEFAEGHELVTAGGHALWLWDTPGFGDSVRLARRLEGSTQPLLGFLRDTWDRLADRPFWCSQQALRNAREEADVVLYLASAAEPPGQSGYLEPELRILGWLGKPVIVLLNQMGVPRAPEVEAAEVARWRAALAAHALVRAVLPLDAFARCWVQESVLWQAVEDALDAPLKPAMAALHAAWRARRERTFEDSMQALAAFLAAAAGDREPVDDPGLSARLREWVRQAVAGGGDGAEAQARARLGARLDAAASACLQRLVALHGLDGAAATRIADELASLQVVDAPISAARGGVIGGALGGAALGLKADLASGGLSFGAGLLVGSVLGALGGAGIVRGVNRLRGVEAPVVSWGEDALARLAREALLRYLAVAHFGRGRGAWREVGAPAHWPGVLDAAIAPRAAALRDALAAAQAAALAPLLGALLREVLLRLHPAGARGAAAD
jgi:hypothetical protein